MKRVLWLVCVVMLIWLGWLAKLTFGQTADVTVLQPAEASEAREAYAQLKAAQKRWDDVRAKIKRVYGIGDDIEFSKDFRAVVWKPATNITVGSNQYPCGGITWSPASTQGTYNSTFKDVMEHKNGSNFAPESR